MQFLKILVLSPWIFRYRKIQKRENLKMRYLIEKKDVTLRDLKEEDLFLKIPSMLF